MKELLQKYRHIVPMLVYCPVYLLWFFWLERTVTTHFHVMHTALDDLIPFCSAFIIPYMLWFLYVVLSVVYFMYKDKAACVKLCSMLIAGMSIALLICTVFPNGTDLRPAVLDRGNFFDWVVAILYKTDTSTNVFPSIHVLNSLLVHTAIVRSASLGERKGICALSLLLSVSICLSTLFLKQHSVLDVAGAIVLAAVLVAWTYRNNRIAEHEPQRVKKVRVS